MTASGMHKDSRYDQEAGLKKSMLWQTVGDECVSVATENLVDTSGDSRRPGKLPFLLPHGACSRSGMSIASTARGSSRASSRCSSACSSMSSTPGSMQSSRSGSSTRSVTRHSKKKLTSSSVASNDSAPAGPHFKASLWDAVPDDLDDEALEVERIEVPTKQPGRLPAELPSLPPLVDVAWQDLEEAVAGDNQRIALAGAELSHMVEREHFVLPASDSRPQSRLSDLDDPIFGANAGTYAGALGNLPADPFGAAADLREGNLFTPAPPASARKAPQRPMGHRKLPPMSLEAEEAASSATLTESTPSARSGHSAGSAATPPGAAAAATLATKEAWVIPAEPKGPPPANRFTRPALRPRASLPEANDAHTKLSL